ncbi:Shikimate kinase [Psidium guajava]|nr:Shikimate kinase [Psidium guajava]
MNEVNARAWYSDKTLLSGLLQKRSISFLCAAYPSFKLKCQHMRSESALTKLCGNKEIPPEPYLAYYKCK